MRASGVAVRALFRLIPLPCGHKATHGGTHSVAAIADISRLISAGFTWAARINSGPEGPLYRVDGPSGFTQAAEKSWKDHL